MTSNSCFDRVPLHSTAKVLDPRTKTLIEMKAALLSKYHPPPPSTPPTGILKATWRAAVTNGTTEVENVDQLGQQACCPFTPALRLRTPRGLFRGLQACCCGGATETAETAGRWNLVCLSARR
ncbi:hypothetical protein CYMTET_32431 [Cymbomonas tetramitiformis]|uniref:Uncharacterized protein n=1 Tax=Cymbomonas tetramitiformis TaxID=36881 RepID=A0AAE0KRX7_9CHLO|nr:hypothetical protein CYMTET_32431 [Cymbomonas tetramitiformis]